MAQAMERSKKEKNSTKIFTIVYTFVMFKILVDVPIILIINNSTSQRDFAPHCDLWKTVSSALTVRKFDLPLWNIGVSITDRRWRSLQREGVNLLPLSYIPGRTLPCRTVVSKKGREEGNCYSFRHSLAMECLQKFPHLLSWERHLNMLKWVSLKWEMVDYYMCSTFLRGH